MSRPCTRGFWGKFGEWQNKPCTAAIQSPSQLYPFLFNPVYNVSTLRICIDDIMEVVYTHINDNVEPSTKPNIFVAAFTTCWACLKLYSYLHILQQQVLYYNTDSIIYRWKLDQPSIPVGDFLGEMTDELKGDVITEFVSDGAKNYGYLTYDGKTECKVRGFTLNVRGSALLNYQTMRSNIHTELENPQDHRRVIKVTNPTNLYGTILPKKIKLTARVKEYGLVFDKTRH